MYLFVSGLGVSVCDRLQCVCDYTTAVCMASSNFNHSITSQCSGPRPSCMRGSRSSPQPTDADSSHESSETTKLNVQTHEKPGQTKEQKGKDVGKPEVKEQEGREEGKGGEN